MITYIAKQETGHVLGGTTGISDNHRYVIIERDGVGAQDMSKIMESGASSGMEHEAVILRF